MFGQVPGNKIKSVSYVPGGARGVSACMHAVGPMDYIHDIKPVVNYRFEGPLIKGQFSQLAIGVDTASFQFWETRYSTD